MLPLLRIQSSNLWRDVCHGETVVLCVLIPGKILIRRHVPELITRIAVIGGGSARLGWQIKCGVKAGGAGAPAVRVVSAEPIPQTPGNLRGRIHETGIAAAPMR